MTGPDPAPVPAPGPLHDRDPGLQPERTRLAWRRTTLASTGVAVLAMKTALHDGLSAPGIVAGALFGALWLGFLLMAHQRIRVLTAMATTPPPLVPRHAAAAALCTVALAACGAAVVF